METININDLNLGNIEIDDKIDCENILSASVDTSLAEGNVVFNEPNMEVVFGDQCAAA